MKKKELSLNILKAVAMFSVCSCHFLYYNNTAIDNFVAVFACMCVPTFFMVNGALLMNKPYDGYKHYKRTANLFMVLVIWKIITPLLEWGALKDNIGTQGKAQIVQYILGDNLDDFYVGHFWFMHALIGVYIVYPLIRKCFDGKDGGKYVKYLAGIIGFFSFIINDLTSLMEIASEAVGLNKISFSGLQSYSVFSGYAYCVFYFIIGGLLFEKIQNKKINLKWYWPIVLCFIGWIWLFVLNRYQNTYTNAKWIVINGYERVGTVLLTVGIFIFVCQYADKIKMQWLCKSIDLIADNTMGIYYIHVIIGTYFMVIYDKYFGARGITVNILKTSIFVILGLGLTLLMKKIPMLRKLVT